MNRSPFRPRSHFTISPELARQHVKVVLSGDGGDEMRAGYVWRHADFPGSAASGGRGLCRGYVSCL